VGRAEQTRSLWREYRARPSESLRHQLIVTYAPLVSCVALHFNSRLWVPDDPDDLFCYGLIGLVDAMRRFDPDRDGRFVSFAVPYIRDAMKAQLLEID